MNKLTETKPDKEPIAPEITPETVKDKEALIKYIPLAEIIARKEMKLMPPYLADFKELVNIGLIKVNSLIQDAATKLQTYNSSYVAQAIVWEIRNKSRQESHQRGEHRQSQVTGYESSDGFTISEIREAVFETVASYEESSFEITDDNAIDPAEAIELEEMKKAIREAIVLLPENYRKVVEMRFVRGLKGIEIAELLGVSSTRVTKIIQESVNIIKERLAEKRLL